MHTLAAQMANLLVAKSSGPPTILSNGPIPDTKPMLKALDTVKILGCKVVTEKIAQLVPAESPEVGVTVHLEDGKSMHLGYLIDKPPTVLASRGLIDQLGLDVESHPLMGEHIKGLELGGTTKVPGVFVVGDAGTPMKAVANAISSGKLRGLEIGSVFYGFLY